MREMTPGNNHLDKVQTFQLCISFVSLIKTSSHYNELKEQT